MQTCEAFQGKLLSLESCNELTLLNEDMTDKEYVLNQQFILGSFSSIPAGAGPNRRRQEATATTSDS